MIWLYLRLLHIKTHELVYNSNRFGSGCAAVGEVSCCRVGSAWLKNHENWFSKTSTVYIFFHAIGSVEFNCPTRSPSPQQFRGLWPNAKHYPTSPRGQGPSPFGNRRFWFAGNCVWPCTMSVNKLATKNIAVYRNCITLQPTTPSADC